MLPNLEFRRGVAENIPVDEHTVDVVMNVESSHCYKDQQAFFAEVHRILNDDGLFAICDFRTVTGTQELKQEIIDQGFELLHEQDITPHVLTALDVMHESRETLLEQRVPRIWRSTMRDFAALKGSAIYEMFRNGEMLYFSFLFKRKDMPVSLEI